MKSIFFSIVLLSTAAFANGGDGPGNSGIQSLHCRLSSNLKNYDFVMQAPKLEAAPYGMGGSIGSRSKKIQTATAKVEVQVTYVDTAGVNFDSANGAKNQKSVLLTLKVLSDDSMPYTLKADSSSNLLSFSDEVDSSVGVDTTPLGFDGKISLWCSTKPIQ